MFKVKKSTLLSNSDAITIAFSIENIHRFEFYQGTNYFITKQNTIEFLRFSYELTFFLKINITIKRM